MKSFLIPGAIGTALLAIASVGSFAGLTPIVQSCPCDACDIGCLCCFEDGCSCADCVCERCLLSGATCCEAECGAAGAAQTGSCEFCDATCECGKDAMCGCREGCDCPVCVL